MLLFSRVYWIDGWHSMICSEEEYLDLLEKLPKTTSSSKIRIPISSFAKMGAEAIYDLLSRLDLDALCLWTASPCGTDASQRKTETLKRLRAVESFHHADATSPNGWLYALYRLFHPNFVRWSHWMVVVSQLLTWMTFIVVLLSVTIVWKFDWNQSSWSDFA